MEEKDLKSINLETLSVTTITDEEKEITIAKEVYQGFCNTVYNTTGDIAEKDLIKKFYYNPSQDLNEEELKIFKAIIEKFSNKYFTAVVQEALLKQINN